MSITVTMPPDSETKLRRQAAERGDNVDQYAAAVLEKSLRDSSSAVGPTLDDSRWMQLFNEWLSSHPANGHFVDDKRESIYE